MSNNILELFIPTKSGSCLIKTRNGIVIDANYDVWEYKDKLIDVRLDFNTMPVSPVMRESIKSNFVWHAENLAPGTLLNLFGHLSSLLLYTSNVSGGNISEITEDILISYRSSLIKRKEWRLGYIKKFFKRWHDLSLPGLHDNAVKFLKLIKLKGCEKGESVRTLDPLKGPFSDLEFQAINSALHTAYKAQTISLQTFLLVWLFMAKGHRSIQYAALRVSDFTVSSNRHGDIVYLLYVPRAKQRGKFTRDTLKANKIISKLGMLFSEHIQSITRMAEALGIAPQDMPLFPRQTPRLGAPKGYEWHHTTQSLRLYLNGALNLLDITSERTGRPLKVTPQRFRYSLGSRMAMEGHPPAIIAEALDHTDVQNVGVYTQNHPQIIKHLDKAMAMALAPIAQAFLGEIVSDADLKLSGARKIRDPRFGSVQKAVGGCSQHGFCGALAPFSCYICRDFRAWKEGPHQAVLEHLLQERERLAEEDLRIAANLDRMILAVADVVHKCALPVNSKEICNG